MKRQIRAISAAAAGICVLAVSGFSAYAAEAADIQAAEAADIQAAEAAAIQTAEAAKAADALAAAGDQTNINITWADMFGPQDGVLTLDPSANTWELNFENPYGFQKILGAYSPEDGSMEVTDDMGMGEFFPFEAVASVAEPAILEFLKGEDPEAAATCTPCWRSSMAKSHRISLIPIMHVMISTQ